MNRWQKIITIVISIIIISLLVGGVILVKNFDIQMVNPRNNADISSQKQENIKESNNQEMEDTNSNDDAQKDEDNNSSLNNRNNDEEQNIDKGLESTFTEQSITTSEMMLKYFLYTPKNAQKNMPLIIYLHGGTGKGNNLNKVLYDGFPKYLKDGLLKDLPAYIIIPQLPANKKGWIDIKTSLNELVNNAINTYSINSYKVSLTGHSMGGTGTWELALAYPELFSCIVPMSGSIKNIEENRNILSNIPIWAFVGAKDTIVEPTSSITFINDLKRINSKANITIIEDATHFEVPKAYLNTTYNVITWMLSQ